MPQRFRMSRGWSSNPRSRNDGRKPTMAWTRVLFANGHRDDPCGYSSRTSTFPFQPGVGCANDLRKPPRWKSLPAPQARWFDATHTQLLANFYQSCAGAQMISAEGSPHLAATITMRLDDISLILWLFLVAGRRSCMINNEHLSFQEWRYQCCWHNFKI